jgi:hypothetical protein
MHHATTCSRISGGGSLLSMLDSTLAISGHDCAIVTCTISSHVHMVLNSTCKLKFKKSQLYLSTCLIYEFAFLYDNDVYLLHIPLQLYHMQKTQLVQNWIQMENCFC